MQSESERYTFKKGTGMAISTLINSLLSLATVKSVNGFKASRRHFSPSLVDISVPLKSFSSISPVFFSVLIITFSEFRILHTVDVDSLFLGLKIFIPSILLINVDFPALVSPTKTWSFRIQKYPYCKTNSIKFSEFIFSTHVSLHIPHSLITLSYVTHTSHYLHMSHSTYIRFSLATCFQHYPSPI